MAIQAGCPFMADAGHSTAAGRMSKVETGRHPGAGVVALTARHPREQAGMECRVGMTAGAGRGNP